MKLGGKARRRRKHKQKNAVLDARRNWRLSYEEMCAHVILECIVVCPLLCVHPHILCVCMTDQLTITMTSRAISTTILVVLYAIHHHAKQDLIFN